MIPETNIRTAFSDFTLHVGRFPQSGAEALPRGVIRRISQVPILTKDGIPTWFETSVQVIIYEENALNFDTYFATILTLINGLTTDANISNAYMEERDQGYVLENDELEWMSVDITIKHKNVP